MRKTFGLGKIFTITIIIAAYCAGYGTKNAELASLKGQLKKTYIDAELLRIEINRRDLAERSRALDAAVQRLREDAARREGGTTASTWHGAKAHVIGTGPIIKLDPPTRMYKDWGPE